ncbi:1-acyl-sn-glycerol-3-phosphate acyltransferase [Nonomuraea zeae]|uniref:Phospholipid/glycerol acyltransferase domain-containing protein n=1 Tax=Nonomuraea zeae TaxID=1642303 RepID=A0A5S4FYX6_9ACTN|nr:1-acyl-sn-glycerol-3-phosphate acyltransferase [Nonomuraea zeae]TMR25792.1 hypothetical protein ETD85_44690 [Nonomuraea zeae]
MTTAVHAGLTAAGTSRAEGTAGLLHRVARLLAAVLVVLAGTPLALVASRAHPARRAGITRVWARTLLRALGVKVHVTAPPAVVPPVAGAGGGGALVVANHVSWLYPLVIANALRAGHTVAAFPEGTTWCGRGMGRFRPAVFQAAVDAAAEVRPVTLRYREGGKPSTRACFVGDDSLLASALRVASTRDLVAEVTILAPIRHS